MILSRILESEIGVRGGRSVARCIVDEAVRAPLLDEFDLEVELRRQLPLESQAPVQEARGFERIRSQAECHGYGAGVGIPIRVEKIIDSLPRQWTRYQEQRGRIIEETHAGREFGIARAVENVICRKTRRNQRVAHDLIPVVAQATFHEEAIGYQPAVLRVSA